MERTSGLPLELKATLHARSPTRTRSTSHQLIAGDALYAAPDTLPRSGFVHGRETEATGRIRNGSFGVSNGDKRTFDLGNCRRQLATPLRSFEADNSIARIDPKRSPHPSSHLVAVCSNSCTCCFQNLAK